MEQNNVKVHVENLKKSFGKLEVLKDIPCKGSQEWTYCPGYKGFRLIL